MLSYFKLAKWILYIIPLGIVVVTNSTLFPFIVGKYVWFRALMGLAVILFALGLFLDKQADEYWTSLKKAFKSQIGIATVFFTGIFLLAGFLGIDSWFSFWSNYERGEGGLQIILFYTFFILLLTLLKNKSDWKFFLWSFILSAWFMIFYGVASGLGWSGFLGGDFGVSGFRFKGSIGNPAYVAVYLLFASFLASYLWIKDWKNTGKISKWLSGISSAIFIVIILLTATRGAFLGLMFGLVVAAIYLAWYYPKWRWILAGLVLLGILTVGGLVAYKDTEPIKNWPVARLLDLSLSTKTFQDRLTIWGIAYEGIKERPILGYGPGNFLPVFYKHYDPSYFKPGEDYGAWFDRAHNIFLDYMIAAGVMGLLAYLGIFIIFIVTFFKNQKRINKELDNKEKWEIWRERLLQALFIATPLAYLVQGLVLFDVSTTYLIMFAFFALASVTYDKKNIDYV